jgi:hypothetical protein
MQTRCETLLDHLADYLFKPPLPSFFFSPPKPPPLSPTLLCQLVVASPLVMLSLHHPLVVLLHQLGVALPLAIASPIVILSLKNHVLSCQLGVALPLTILSLYHPFILSSR